MGCDGPAPFMRSRPIATAVNDQASLATEPDVGSHAGPLAVVVLAVFVVFVPVTTFEFIDCDDYVHVVANRRLVPPSLERVIWFWQNPHRGLYIPLAYTFFAAEAELALSDAATDGLPGVDPRVFHTGSLILHMVCACLVYLLLVELVHRRWAAVAGAVLFAVHPLQVESVAWISITPGLLATALSLFALWQYVVYCKQEAVDATRQSQRIRFTLTTVALMAALLCKPTAAATPLVAVALRFLWMGRPLRTGWLGLGLWFSLAGLTAAVAKSIQTDSQIIGLSSLWLRPLVATDAIAFYTYKLLLPLGLCLDYSRTPARVVEQGWLYYTWVLPLGIVVALWWGGAGRKWWTVFFVSVAGLAPVLGLLPFGYQQISTVADRYVYLAMFGPALAVAWWLATTTSRNPPKIVAGGLLFLAALSIQQCHRWHDSAQLAKHGLAVNPESYLLHMLQGDARNREGQTTLALQDFYQAQQLAPQLPAVHDRLGHALLSHAKPILASEAFRLALEIEPRYLSAQNGVGLALTAQRRFEEAILAFRAALEIRDDSAAVHNNLGEALRQAGEANAAMAEYRKAVELDPRMENAQNNLGLELVAQGKRSAATEHFQQALQLLPHSAELHNSLGAVYFQQAQWQRAMAQFTRALELRPGFREAELNLEAVRARMAQ